MARPGSYAGKPLLRKAFCGFAVHAAKSDQSLRGLRPPNPQGFFDKLTPPEAGGETDDGQAKGSTMMGTVLACQLTLSSNR